MDKQFETSHWEEYEFVLVILMLLDELVMPLSLETQVSIPDCKAGGLHNVHVKGIKNTRIFRFGRMHRTLLEIKERGIGNEGFLGSILLHQSRFPASSTDFMADAA